MVSREIALLTAPQTMRVRRKRCWKKSASLKVTMLPLATQARRPNRGIPL